MKTICKMERTYIMIKPDAVQRGLIGNIINRFETKGFKLVCIKSKMATSDLLHEHYIDLVDKPFFPKLHDFMLSGPVVCMVWMGKDAVKTGRKMLGETDPFNSAPGTIRGDLCIEMGRNICHGSDSIESAEREISLWFEENEVLEPFVETFVSRWVETFAMDLIVLRVLKGRSVSGLKKMRSWSGNPILMIGFTSNI